MYVMLVIAAVFILIAEKIASQYKKRSAFTDIMAGAVTIAAGVDWIAQDPSTWTHIFAGVCIAAFGFYYLIMVGVDLFKGD